VTDEIEIPHVGDSIRRARATRRRTCSGRRRPPGRDRVSSKRDGGSGRMPLAAQSLIGGAPSRSGRRTIVATRARRLRSNRTELSAATARSTEQMATMAQTSRERLLALAIALSALRAAFAGCVNSDVRPTSEELLAQADIAYYSARIGRRGLRRC
jgi:hypothetical protein